MKYFAIIFAVLLCGVSAFPRKDDGPQCQSPNGGGLIPVFKEFIDILSLDEILAIYLNAVSNDPEVQAVMEFLESDEFFEVMTGIHNTPEFPKIVVVFCDEYYVDVVYYFNILHEILGHPIIPRPIHMNMIARARTGLHGLILDLIDVIDVDALKELFNEKSKTDEYLKNVLEYVKTKDFYRLAEKLHTIPAFEKMLTELHVMGVHVEMVIEFLRNFLGWN